MFTHLVPMESVSWFPWLLDILVKSTLLLALVGLVALACWRASAAQRHLIWMLAVIGVLLLPVLSTVLPAWHVVRLPAWRSTSVHIQAPSNIPVQSRMGHATTQETQQPSSHQLTKNAETPRASSASAGVEPPNTPMAPATPEPSIQTPASSVWPTWPWYAWATLVWGIGSAMVFTWWVYGYALTRRMFKHATQVPETWKTEVPAGVRLLKSHTIAMPVVVGIRRPTILLPAQAEEWSEERRRVVLLHELAHIQRRDLLAHFLVQLACASYWMNPLIWYAAYRMRVEREAACDDVVLNAEIKASDYATHLLNVASALQERHLAPVAGIAMARSSKVGRRIRGVLDERRNRRGVTSRMFLATLLFGSMVCAILAVLQGHRVYSATTTSAPKVIPFPATALRESVTVSPDGEHIAFVNVINGRYIAVVDGTADQPSVRIVLRVLPTARYMGHTVPTSNPASVLSQYGGSFFFSPDGRKVAYVAETESIGEQKPHMFVAIAGERRGFYNLYDEVDAPLFSPDGKHVAYGALRGNTWVVVQDGKESHSYVEIGLRGPARIQHNEYGDQLISGIAPVFSPDSQRLAFGAWNGRGWVVVVNGQEGQPYDAIGDLTFGPDGKHLAYVGRRDGKAYLVFDGQESPAYDDIRYPTFSPDSKRFAYAAQRGYAGLLVCDGQERKTNSGISPIVIDRPVFSPDSAHVAVSATLEGRDTPRTIIIDGAVVTKTFAKVDEPIFSPDSRRIAYTARRYPGKAYLVLAAVPAIATEPEVRVQQEIPSAGNPVFNPDGTRFAYMVSEAGVSRVVVDEKALPAVHGRIPEITFSPDGAHIVYVAHQYVGVKTNPPVISGLHITIDGKEEPGYPQLGVARSISAPHQKRYIFFDAPDRFHYFAVKDGVIERVEVTIPPSAETQRSVAQAADRQQPIAQTKKGDATPNSDPPVSLDTKVLAENDSITTYEPVLVRVEERNESADTVTMPMAWATPYTERILIEDAKGRLVASSPWMPIPVDFTSSIVKLKPGESRIRMLAVSAVYPFDKPGDYTVRIQRLKLQDEISVLAEDQVTVHVLPFDAVRLKARCENLFKYTRSAPGERDLSMSDLTRALLSVRHNIALPYIDWLARNRGSFEACSAMRLIGTPKALRELNTLAKRQDKLGRTARGVLEMRMDQIIWGTLGDHD